MNLREFIDNVKIHDNYKTKKQPYDNELQEIYNRRVAEIHATNAKYDLLMSEKIEELIRNCGKQPSCNHELLVEFSIYRVYQYENDYYCLECGDDVTFLDGAREHIIKVGEVKEEEIPVYMSMLKNELMRLYREKPDISLKEVAEYLTSFINTKTKARI